MGGAERLDVTLLGGARELLMAHARELPQRDDLCGAFCGALALDAADVRQPSGHAHDQDAVAQAAGSVVSREPDPSCLPRGERGRRDYRISPPLIDDGAVSGTTAGGLVDAIDRLSGGELSAIPYGGPWTGAAVDGLFEIALECERPVTMIANVATGVLWGAEPRPDQLLGYLLDGELAGPPPDWEVGHFVCVIGRIRGAGGNLYVVADTYPSLGRGGVHVQPRELLAAALQRRGIAPGGMIVVSSCDEAGALRSAAAALGLSEGIWDNGTIARATSG
jgi:hypothetical protein